MTHPSGDHFQISIGGGVGGDVQVGHHNQIIKTPPPVSAADLATYRAAVDDLKAQLAQAGAALDAQQQAEAAAQLEALHAAATAPKPDLDTMQRVRGWFANHLPTFAGAVTGLLVHPVVGIIVKSAGEAVSSEFKRRFGAAESAAE